MQIKPDYIVRDNLLVPNQLQIVDADTGDLLATLNVASERGKYLTAAMFIGFDALGVKVKDETHIVDEGATAQPAEPTPK